jgi:hypothetical protein
MNEFVLCHKEVPVLDDPEEIQFYIAYAFPNVPPERKYKIKNIKLCVSIADFLKTVERPVYFTNLTIGKFSVDKQGFNFKQVEGIWVLAELNLTKVLE